MAEVARRWRRRTESCSSEEVVYSEISGITHLCFPEDGSWFQGYLVADDNTTYGLIGKRIKKWEESADKRLQQNGILVNGKVKCDNECQHQLVQNGGQTNSGCSEGISVEFDIVLVDHEAGIEYPLPRVMGRNGLMCTFQCREITFTTEQVFRGSKADMVIQKILGSALVGQNCHVFVGPMKVCYRDTFSVNKANWCL